MIGEAGKFAPGSTAAQATVEDQAVPVGNSYFSSDSGRISME